MLVVTAVGAGCGRGSSGPVNVLVVTLDTLRADRVGVYGYAAATTPTLDALAARGARFANATTTTPLTLAAHTSLFTGTFPGFHGVRDNTIPYSESQVLKVRARSPVELLLVEDAGHGDIHRHPAYLEALADRLAKLR